MPLEVNIDFTTVSETEPQCYDVAILDDDIVEMSEVFRVELTEIVGFVTIIQSIVTITIIPNQERLDSKCQLSISFMYC